MLHPDRHTSREPALKQAAESRFQAISTAYEILSDPHRRAIYDALGKEALKSSWDVQLDRRQTPDQARSTNSSQALTLTCLRSFAPSTRGWHA